MRQISFSHHGNTTQNSAVINSLTSPNWASGANER